MKASVFFQESSKKELRKIKWTNKKTGDVLGIIKAKDGDDLPYGKLTYKLPSNNNDLWGLVEVNRTSGVLTMKKELEEEKRHVITLVTH